jgi:SAM-dependent methyltransferase
MTERVVDLGHVYDDVAETYDADSFGIIRGAHALFLEQLAGRGLPEAPSVLDLGVGTGDALLALSRQFPGGRRIGIDLSAGMLARAQAKVAFEGHVDDACNAGAHVQAGSIDLVLAHFLTTFVDRSRLFHAAKAALAPGGLFSVISSPDEAFPKIRGYVAQLLGETVVRGANPAPTTDELVNDLNAAGFDVCRLDRLNLRPRFETFEHTIDWALKGGFFTHFVEAVGPEKLAQLGAFAADAGIFPLEDDYVAAVVLATPSRA